MYILVTIQNKCSKTKEMTQMGQHKELVVGDKFLHLFVWGHKRCRNILGWEEVLKFRSCKILEGRGQANQGRNFNMGEGGIKKGPKNSDVFYGRPPTCNLFIANYVQNKYSCQIVFDWQNRQWGQDIFQLICLFNVAKKSYQKLLNSYSSCSIHQKSNHLQPPPSPCYFYKGSIQNKLLSLPIC